VDAFVGGGQPIDGHVKQRLVLIHRIGDKVEEMVRNDVVPFGGGTPRFECAEKPFGVFKVVPLLDDLFSGH
jgi:hypothetical protein